MKSNTLYKEKNITWLILRIVIYFLPLLLIFDVFTFKSYLFIVIFTGIFDSLYHRRFGIDKEAFHDMWAEGKLSINEYIGKLRLKIKENYWYNVSNYKNMVGTGPFILINGERTRSFSSPDDFEKVIFHNQWVEDFISNSNFILIILFVFIHDAVTNKSFFFRDEIPDADLWVLILLYFVVCFIIRNLVSYVIENIIITIKLKYIIKNYKKNKTSEYGIKDYHFKTE